jgi:pilus assembly protein CpaE
MTQGRVLVVDDTKLITKMIHDKLAANGYEVAEAYDGPEALKRIKSFAPDLVILDVMLPGMDGYQVARTIRQDPQHNHTPIIMLTAKSGIAEKIAGFEAGADDYLTKPFDPTELELRARALIARARAARTEGSQAASGKVITVFSLRGGSGVSAIAVNLAVTLAQLYEMEIPLLDLSLETGGASIMLDLMPRMTLSHLAKEETAVLDFGLISEYLVKHSSGVRLLAAPTTPVLAELVTPNLVNQILTTLRSHFSHVVVDTPHDLSEPTLAALDLADTILMVVPPDMASLKAATGALETFASLGYPDTRIAVLINWVFPRRGLPQREIESALSRPILATIPYESEAVVRSINEGVPLVIAQPTSIWGQSIEALGFQLSSSDAKARAEAGGLKRFAAAKKRLAA